MRAVVGVGCGLLVAALVWSMPAKNSPAAPPESKVPASPAKVEELDLAAELPRLPPHEPADAIGTFKLAPGFHVELAAAEPEIRSPVAIDFDEDGRMYVAEFPEYNQHGDPNFKQHGSIKLLEDTRGTGTYDKVTLFADEVDCPMALACWDGGLFVGTVPNIIYLKDTQGAGKADMRKVVYTGFARDRAGEGMLNSLHWGLDHRFHLSTGIAGGAVKVADAKDALPVNVRGHAFLFDPRTLKFELVAGSGQHGMSQDDWGRTFTCDNSNPCYLLMYDGRYLARNPYVQAPPPMLNIHQAERANYLKRISPNEPFRVVRTRLRLAGAFPGSAETGFPSGHFTGTTGATIYRGDAYPPEYRGTLFVGEVANNLVFHAKLQPKGLELATSRFEDDREFLASTDNWFRPAQFAHAPDGTLYLIDHYRELIETIDSIPPQVLKHLHPESGIDRGRIYRLAPDGFQRPKLPQLSKATTAELVKLLEHPNAWHRDTASRLLFQRQDASAVGALEKLAKESASPLGRVHALYALDGLHALAARHVLPALSDPEPRLREHALRLAEQFTDDPAIAQRVTAMIDDPELSVRYQTAFTLGAFTGPNVSAALYRLLTVDGQNSWMRLAILTSAHDRRSELLGKLLADEALRGSTEGKALIRELAVQIGAANQSHELADFLATIDGLPTGEAALGRELMSSLMSKLPAKARQRIAADGRAGQLFEQLLAAALKTAENEQLAAPQRVTAVRTLGLAEFSRVQPLFADLLKFRQPETVQKAALETLARFDQPAAAELVIEAWKGLSPQVRASAAETLFARAAWTAIFLDAVERGTIKPADVDPARVKLVQAAADPKIRERFARLFQGNQLSQRTQLVAAYQKALELKGDVATGKELFKKNCSACHKLEGVGEQIGAELSAIRDRGPEFMLLNILDPNREVLPKFITYYVVTDSGRTLTGMILSETANSITLRRPDNTNETLLRVNIEELRSTGQSFMPEGLEKQLDHQQMADLIAYLLSIR